MSEVMSLEQAAALLLGAITAIVAGGLGSAPITTLLVSILKHIPALKGFSSSSIQFGVGAVLTVLFWVAQHFGYEVQFRSAVDILLAIGPGILMLLATLSGSSLWYRAAQKTGAGLMGSQRAVG